jgi:hypothetical protein
MIKLNKAVMLSLPYEIASYLAMTYFILLLIRDRYFSRVFKFAHV